MLPDSISTVWAVVPIKDFAGAKERLSSVLRPSERRALARVMAEDVLRTLLAVSEFEGVAVVTRDAEARRLCAGLGARVLPEPRNRGQTAAVMAASRTLEGEGVTDVLTVPGDVPLALPRDVRSVMAAHGAAPAMTIVPARDRRGSNCVVLSPPGCVALRFGENSFYPHLEAARATGISPRAVESPNLALDVDTPDDLDLLMRQPARTRAQEFLARAGVAGRFRRRPDAAAEAKAGADAVAAGAAR